MSKFDDPAFFGHVWSDVYDVGSGHDPTEAVDFLADLVGRVGAAGPTGGVGAADPTGQLDCFRNAARVLGPGGAFVLECYIPDPSVFDRSARVSARAASDSSATIDVYSHNHNAQTFIRQRITFDENGMRMRPHAE